MAQTYHLTFRRRLANLFIKALLRLGVKVDGTHLLNVKGRRSGKIHTTPVTLIEQSGQRWLVAPYGEVNWVSNARAAGRVTLRRGRHAETVTIVELSNPWTWILLAPVIPPSLIAVCHDPDLLSFRGAHQDSLVSMRASHLHQTGPRAVSVGSSPRFGHFPERKVFPVPQRHCSSEQQRLKDLSEQEERRTAEVTQELSIRCQTRCCSRYAPDTMAHGWLALRLVL